jgi:hypothetical protein
MKEKLSRATKILSFELFRELIEIEADQRAFDLAEEDAL